MKPLQFQYIGPNKFRVVGTDEIVTEREALEMQIQHTNWERSFYEVEFEVTEQIIKDKGGKVSIAFVNECLSKHGIELPEGNSDIRAELWEFLYDWYKTNKSYYGFVKPLLHIEP